MIQIGRQSGGRMLEQFKPLGDLFSKQGEVDTDVCDGLNCTGRTQTTGIVEYVLLQQLWMLRHSSHHKIVRYAFLLHRLRRRRRRVLSPPDVVYFVL